MSPAEFSIKNRLLSWIVIVISLALGAFAYANMPRFEDPEFLIRTAQIVTEYPGATPEEVANEVSEAIETEIQGMQEISEIRSTAYTGYSVISVDIKHNFSKTKTDLQLVWARLRAKVSDAERSLPPGSGSPMINDDYGDVFGLYYLITGDGFSLKELETYSKDLRKDLLSVEGVAKISTLGEQPEVITVEISRDRAAALGVSISDVYEDLSRQNTVAASGSVKIADQRIAIRPSGKLNSVDAIGNLLVSAPGIDNLIPLRDIAKIRRQTSEPAILHTRYNGSPAIALGISNVSGANVADIGDGIRAKLALTLAKRPNGVSVEEFYHQGDAVNTAVSDFAFNVLIALLIVLVTLLLFMGLRSALIIGALLTITISATLATMYLTGIPMHRISLGALIIALGMLVDNAIVITEGILIGSKSGQTVLTSAKQTVGKTKWALLGGTVVGVLAFAPIGFAPGDTAEYTNHLFWVILISLSFSWIFAITLVPMLADVVFPAEKKRTVSVKSDGLAMRFYKSLLSIVLKFRWAVISVAVIAFSVSIFSFQYVKSGFFPTSTTPQIAIDYWLPQGTDISATARDVALIEQHLANYNSVENIHSIIGAGGLRYMLIYAPEFPNSAYGQLILKIDDIQNIDVLMPQIQAYLDGTFPAAQSRVWRFQLGPSQGSKIEAAFSGPDARVLRELAAEATQIFVQDNDSAAVKTDWRQEVPVIVPKYDPVRGGRVGVSQRDLTSALEATFSGVAIGVYREGDDLIPILSRAPDKERFDLETVAGIQIPSRQTGGTIPLSEVLTDVEIVWEDGLQMRRDRTLTLKVQADPKPGTLASELHARLRLQIEAISLPVGYSLKWDGEYGASEKANRELAGTLPIGLIAMILTVILLFNALRQTAVIWLTVPLAAIGVVVGLLVTGTALEFMALLGILSLAGLLIKNAIVLVDQMDDEIKAGKPRHDAVIDSAASRVRPVLMGSLTTILGVMPLMADVFFASMAVVIVFGLSFATLLTLIVLPAIYAAVFNIKAQETAQLAQEQN